MNCKKSYLIQYLLNDGNITKISVEKRDTRVKIERRANHNHSSKKILSLIMFKLRTHIAWSTFRFPVSAPDGNWHLKLMRWTCFKIFFETLYRSLTSKTRFIFAYEVTVGNNEHIGLAIVAR